MVVLIWLALSTILDYLLFLILHLAVSRKFLGVLACSVGLGCPMTHKISSSSSRNTYRIFKFRGQFF